MKKIQILARRFFESRPALHLTFIVLFLAIFSSPAFFSSRDFMVFRLLFISLFFLGCVYAGRYCCRRWFFTNHFPRFLLCTSAVLLLMIAISVAGFGLFITGRFTWSMAFGAAAFTVLFFLFGLFLSITRTTVLQQLREAGILQQHKESELALLRSQLSPHFLFNVLNNLYGLSLTAHEKIPGLLIKLSDLLRYSVYDTRQDFVPVDHELAYINNYIDLEKIRIGDRLELACDFPGSGLAGVTIPPMLLIVFIENAFKHAKNTYSHKIWIDMKLNVTGEGLQFRIRNSCGDETGDAGEDASSGIGLEIARKRLALLYPRKFVLEEGKKDDFYEVNLQLLPNGTV